MSLKKIEQVKADKGFKIWDLIIYGVIAAAVIVSFAVILTTCNSNQLSGVKISVGSKTSLSYTAVFEYEFGKEPKVLSDTVSVEEDDKGITVTVKTEKDGLNVIYIDKSQKTVKMIKANCRSKDCMLLPIENNSGLIVCNSHGVKVEPLVEKDWDSPDIQN